MNIYNRYYALSLLSILLLLLIIKIKSSLWMEFKQDGQNCYKISDTARSPINLNYSTPATAITENAKTTSISNLETSKDSDISCYEVSTARRRFPRFEFVIAQQLSSGKNIFFHETTCYGHSGFELNGRQACSIESAAKMNPNMQVHLLLLSRSKPTPKTEKLIEQLLKYDNLHISYVEMDEYIRGTPIENWFPDLLEHGNINKNNWAKIHVADILRYLTIWKFGGIYLDLDVIVTKSLESMQDFAGAQEEVNVAAGIFSFSMSELGRKVADECLKDLMKNFNNYAWGNNGPGVITRVLQKICKVTYAKDMNPERCEGFDVPTPPVFYPIRYPRWTRYFEMEDFNNTMKVINKAHAVHVWNKLSASKPVRIGSKVPYDVIAEKYCPNVYKNIGPVI